MPAIFAGMSLFRLSLLQRALSRLLLVLFTSWALVQGAAAASMPICDQAPSAAMAMHAADAPAIDAAEHRHSGHAAADSQDAADPGDAGGDCQGCGLCHLACSALAITVAELRPALLAGADAPLICATANCTSHVGDPPLHPPKNPR